LIAISPTTVDKTAHLHDDFDDLAADVAAALSGERS